MKNLVILTLVLLASNAYTQAISHTSNSMQFRDYANNSEPLANKVKEANLPANQRDFEVLLSSSDTNSALSVAVVIARLEQKRSSEQIPGYVGEESAVDSSQTVKALTTDMKAELSVYPNPTRSRCTIKIVLNKPSEVSLRLYASSGKLLREILNKEFIANQYDVVIDVSDLSAGRYMLTLQTAKLWVSEAVIVTK
ncbi:MAG: T9SS type A sorting domain-containing protein [Crocinitomicaceae bacterium]